MKKSDNELKQQLTIKHTTRNRNIKRSLTNPFVEHLNIAHDNLRSSVNNETGTFDKKSTDQERVEYCESNNISIISPKGVEHLAVSSK